MRHRYPLIDVVGALPERLKSPLLSEVEEAALQVNVTPSGVYVWPDLLVSSEIVDSPIVLISAPGAMGKSVAARAVAASLKAPFVNLSHLSVGSNTLTGLLARVLGWTQTPELMNDLRQGKSALVLDGIDEAQLRAGRQNTIAFLQNIVELVRNAEASVGQVVIFGRSDAIDTSYLVFSDNGIEPFMADIAPMSRLQANELITLDLDRKIVSDRPYDVHRVHPGPSAELRDQLFTDIAGALDAVPSDGEDYWQSVEDFLGYPPVLLVFAERLAVDNPSADLSEMRVRAGGTTRQHGDLLRKIVEGILDRESEKVRNQLAQVLSLSSRDPKVQILYTREEQLLRVLNFTSNNLNLNLVPPASLSNGERAIYDEQISTFVPDHPFLRDRKFANVVFGDYVRAFVATNSEIGAYGPSATEVLQSCLQVGPFFADLVYSLLSEQSGDTSPENEAQLSDEGLIDDLISSYYSGRVGGEASFLYTHTQDEAHLTLYEVRSAGIEGRRQGGDGLFFKIQNPIGILELTTPLMRGIIVSQYGLVLRSLSDEIEIGPNFLTFVNELEIIGRRLTALGGRENTEDSESILVVNQSVQHDGALRINAYPPNALSIVWSNAWHMWRPYIPGSRGAAEPDYRAEMLPAEWQVMVGVRRILTAFRGTANNPSVNKDRLDKYSTGHNPVFVAVLGTLIDLGIVQRDSSTYRLQLSALSDYGVNYAAIRGADFSTTLASLTAKIVSIERVRTALSEFNG